MSDSVDRVFSHALNTVNKIRTGSQKPPSATRLRLYGLYKQAMEGDVDGIMERPDGTSEQAQRAKEKWHAWKQQNGLSRTEAKRRYITTLIDTMHKFASPSPDSRELVAELEFVWDQVKSNVPSSSSPSPSYGPLQLQSPMSQSDEELDEDEDEDEADMDRQEFVDAPDAQCRYSPNAMHAMHAHAGVHPDAKLARLHPLPMAVPETPTPAARVRSMLPQSIPMPTFSSAPKAGAPPESAADKKWRARVEQALQKMTAEVAALREQLEARRLFSHSPHYRLARGIWRWLWAVVKHVAVDVFLLGLVLLYMRRKKDTRLEGAIRVLLGGAVAQVQKVGGAQLGKVKLPGLGKKT
ncbi:hypothetical protein ACEQ8H_005446 [Pleosporales sp. CAS-2024a]